MSHWFRGKSIYQIICLCYPDIKVNIGGKADCPADKGSDPQGKRSTGVACVNTGRSFIGIELNDEYFEKATERIKNAEKL